MVAKWRDQDKYNWQGVYTYSTNEVYDYKRGIPPTEGKKGRGKVVLEGLTLQKEILKTKDKVGWLTRKVQRFRPCVCQQ